MAKKSQKDCKYKRPPWDEYFLNLADAIGTRSTCSRGRVGAVFVRDNRILTTGYAGSPPKMPHCDDVGHQLKKISHEDGSVTEHCLRTTHAEKNAIAQAARFGISLEGSTVYCTMAPCDDCSKLLATVGAVRVVAKKGYHASKDSQELFKKKGIELVVRGETEKYTNQ